MPELWDKLRAIRLERGLSLRKVAYEADISAVYLSDVELGHRRPPSVALIKKIAEALGADVEELMRDALWFRGKVELSTYHVSEAKRSLAVALVLKWDGLTDEACRALTQLLEEAAE